MPKEKKSRSAKRTAPLSKETASPSMLAQLRDIATWLEAIWISEPATDTPKKRAAAHKRKPRRVKPLAAKAHQRLKTGPSSRLSGSSLESRR